MQDKHFFLSYNHYFNSGNEDLAATEITKMHI